MKLAEVSKQDNKMKNNILEAYAPPVIKGVSTLNYYLC